MSPAQYPAPTPDADGTADCTADRPAALRDQGQASPRVRAGAAGRRVGRPAAVGLVGLALVLAGCSAPREPGPPVTAETAQLADVGESSGGEGNDDGGADRADDGGSGEGDRADESDAGDDADGDSGDDSNDDDDDSDDDDDDDSDDDALTGGGTGDYEFEYADQRIDVHVANHAQDPAKARILVVMHGTGRSADSYRDAFQEHVQGEEVIVLAPEFSDDDYDKAEDYQLGNLQDEHGDPLPAEESSFAVIEPMVEDAVARIGGSQDSFSMFGHSAGGQFVHRYLAYAPDAPVDAAVSANAGWYMMPGSEGYPYGTQGSPVAVDVDRWLAQDLLVLLGERDVEHDENLRDTPRAMAQGESRLARGKNFVDAGRSAAAGGAFGWELRTVPDAGHDKAEMAPAALEYILGHRE